MFFNGIVFAKKQEVRLETAILAFIVKLNRVSLNSVHDRILKFKDLKEVLL